MKICALSDTHGMYPSLKIDKCELLFICGDIIPLKAQRNIPQSISWFKKRFIPWCTSQPVKHIYLVGGNHDFFLEKSPSEIKDMLAGTNITILYNEGAEYVDDNGKPWTIWGSPLCHIFGNWAFMYSDEYNKSQYEKMPENVDFLITHDAAYGASDVLLQKDCSWTNGEHIGNKILGEIIKRKTPKYHFHGHLHSTSREFELLGETKTINCSLLDEFYDPAYKPIYLDL